MSVLAETATQDTTQVWVVAGMLMITLIVVLVILPIIALIDAASTSRSDYAAAGRDKTAWVLVILFGSALGAAIYWFSVRDDLEVHRRRRRDGRR